ncbi:hypothetical protein PM082_010071 [Marasmius tenuissimus]|nr:hypothetical protein PM082_010071 [Marasmius tenuissimus]
MYFGDEAPDDEVPPKRLPLLIIPFDLSLHTVHLGEPHEALRILEPVWLVALLAEATLTILECISIQSISSIIYICLAYGHPPGIPNPRGSTILFSL